MVGKASFHRGCNAERLVDPAKVVIGEVQGNLGFQILQLFRESIRQPGEPARQHSDGQILALDIAG